MWLSVHEDIVIRNVAFFIIAAGHKKEWYINEIKEKISTNNFEHALAYLDFLISEKKTVSNIYSPYIYKAFVDSLIKDKFKCQK